jgi:AcrR family transcriptional regulator
MQERLTRQNRKDQTRRRLIEAAAVVFADRGFEAATIDEVAAAAGYTKGAVYSNFASKTDLFVALIERRIEIQAAYQASRLEGKGRQAAAESVEGWTPFDEGSERRWMILAMEFWLHAMRDPKARESLAGQYRTARTIAASLLQAYYDRVKEQPPMRPRDLAIVTEALGIGVTFQAMLDPEDVPWSLNGDLDASEIDARNAPYLALARLLRLPLIELQAAETEPTAEGEVPG